MRDINREMQKARECAQAYRSLRFLARPGRLIKGFVSKERGIKGFI
jgi:hypothetical protein